jgi:hypothetical protein
VKYEVKYVPRFWARLWTFRSTRDWRSPCYKSLALGYPYPKFGYGGVSVRDINTLSVCKVKEVKLIILKICVLTTKWNCPNEQNSA